MATSMLPPDKWDKCKFCGSIRKESQGTTGYPKCFRQGCPGQHTKTGLPLKQSYLTIHSPFAMVFWYENKYV